VASACEGAREIKVLPDTLVQMSSELQDACHLETVTNARCTGTQRAFVTSSFVTSSFVTSWLEADLEDGATVAHEPSRLRICKSDGPITAYFFGQFEPSVTFIRSPGS
jgi:hypothetical protein